MKKVLVLLLSMLLCLGMTVGCASNNDEGFKVGLICLHGDNSTYDKNFIDAMKEACKNKGLKDSQLTIVTDVKEDNTCYETAAQLADDGCDVIFADSFGHEAHMIKAAKEFTDVEFCHATGVKAHTENLANYHNAFASIYEGRYLAGVVAGLKLKEMEAAGKIKAENKDEDGNIIIGYVGAFTYAEVVSGYTSFYLGVKSVVDKVVMRVTFTGSWYDELGEKEAAKNLIEKEHCALISQHADSMGAPTACETAGVPNVSYNGSTKTQCPETFLVSSRINWVPYFEYMIDCAKNDKKIDTDWCGDIDNKAVVLTEFGKNVAEGTQTKLDEVKAALKAGTTKVFDVSTFTVTVVAEGENKLNANAKVDANGHLTNYNADVNLGDFVGDTEVVKDGAFEESKYRSAPYFDLQIDGIKLLNVNFG